MVWGQRFNKVWVLDVRCRAGLMNSWVELLRSRSWVPVLLWSGGFLLASPAKSAPLPPLSWGQGSALERQGRDRTSTLPSSATTAPVHHADANAERLNGRESRKAADLVDPLLPLSTNAPADRFIPTLAPTTRLRLFEAEDVSTAAPDYPTAHSSVDLVEPASAIPIQPGSMLVSQDQPRTTPTPINPGDPNSPNPPILLQPTQPVPPGCDPEIGCLMIQPVQAAPSHPPVMYLVPRVDFFSSSNILSGVDPINDGLARPALTWLVFPQLGAKTFLVASVEGALNRYLRLDQFNYDELRLRAGISQQLSPTMSAELGWSNQQLFIASDKIFGFSRGKRFLNDHAIRLEISRRDQLAKHLSLNSFYQFRVSFTNPEDRSRIINVLFLSLNYSATPTLQLGLDYQFASANFTQQSRTDLYHQVLARLTYSAFRNTQVSIYGGVSTGSSTESSINFDGFLLGVSVTVNLVLF